MRHRFISDLVKELLGPRDGATERFSLSDDPKNEYSTGQLIPPNAMVDRAPEEDEGLAANVDAGGEEAEEEATTTFVNQAMIDSGQNFRRIPSSMGVSFVLAEMPKKGDLKVCVTWGRYTQNENSEWLRHPNFWIDLFDGGDNEERPSPDNSLRLTYKLTKIQNGTVKVSVYLSSAVQSANENRLISDQIIFQPELRILLRKPESLCELGDLSFLTNDPEWRLSTRQYDKFQVFARGHLCGAYWKEIDPQRENLKAESDVLPFGWTDGAYFLLKNSEIKEFFVPDIRTDFIPMYSAPAPSIAKDSLNLRADMIASCNSQKELAQTLAPLVTQYQTWIDGLKPDLKAESPDAEIVQRHTDAIARIRAGISFLEQDTEAYYSFLFMNKAMALQYSWGKKPGKEVMSWRPFQLAFILLSLHSTALETSSERNICDTIWFPTGGGKTEAYLGLAAFALAYRRRTSKADESDSRGGEGTCVLSRYTLRLLTIQQFRRALKMTTACEILRCQERDGETIGWKPNGDIRESGMIWGRSPFSLGLWVGSKVTPNALAGKGWKNVVSDGAIELLKRPAKNDTSDPAQIIECPVCASMLSVPVNGIRKGSFTFDVVVDSKPLEGAGVIEALATRRLEVSEASYQPHDSKNCGYLRLQIDLKETISPYELSVWWQEKAENILGVRNCSLNISRPGYFPVESKKGTTTDYEIRCPNADCQLNHSNFRHRVPADGTQWRWSEVHPLFEIQSKENTSLGIPINAITVDKKLYSYPPSMLISTCDKFAGTAFTNEAAAFFGRVRSYTGTRYSQDHETPRSRKFSIENFLPPSLIIQDELHLLEGPLGSSFGLYETVIGNLCGNPKYIASSATIRNANEQIASLIGKENCVFPPVGLDISDGFFLNAKEAHPLDESTPGRLFLGLAFPGRAPQTPMLRTWGRLLQTAQNLKSEGADPKDLDYFWTLIGYFNAVRELAQGETMLRQDIPQYLDKLLKQNPGTTKRPLPMDGFRNLSSQTDSSELPGILTNMERTILQGEDEALNAVATTSMFGTGVDVARLSMMIVHGQPKSASQYIQAVGRIGRQQAGLAIVFFRVSKPRDLNHYEYFTGYHRKLPVAVEPITVKPLAPKALDRSIGALIAALIRNWNDDTINLPTDIDLEEGAALLNQVPPAFLQEVLKYFEEKWAQQPEQRRPPNKQEFLDYVRSQYERWKDYARRQQEAGQALPYGRGGLVVLGSDEQTPSVFPNVPKSLREVEPTIAIYTRED